mmetsp:Transcript_19382/g.33555  ORF Transcript_19382/g.33555 Transcript_19382/m.33555 type:complete len:294 (-) Transcript_19382:2668-3549(-)
MSRDTVRTSWSASPRLSCSTSAEDMRRPMLAESCCTAKADTTGAGAGTGAGSCTAAGSETGEATDAKTGAETGAATGAASGAATGAGLDERGAADDVAEPSATADSTRAVGFSTTRERSTMTGILIGAGFVIVDADPAAVTGTGSGSTLLRSVRFLCSGVVLVSSGVALLGRRSASVDVAIPGVVATARVVAVVTGEGATADAPFRDSVFVLLDAVDAPAVAVLVNVSARLTADIALAMASSICWDGTDSGLSPGRDSSSDSESATSKLSPRMPAFCRLSVPILSFERISRLG